MVLVVERHVLLFFLCVVVVVFSVLVRLYCFCWIIGVRFVVCVCHRIMLGYFVDEVFFRFVQSFDNWR